MIKNVFKGLVVLLAILIVGFVFGPKVEKPVLEPSLPEVPKDLVELEKYINDKEATLSNIKPDNEGRIIWYDSIPSKTEYSILYLHGWSASAKEGDPIHIDLAKRYGCNLYLPRLADHGLNEKEGMLNISADKLYNSSKEALAIAQQLGKKVIIMSTSTGGTLALQLASVIENDIAALVLYSPNIEIFDQTSKALSKPYGLKLAKLIQGSEYYEWDEPNPERRKYWTTKYRMEALTHLQALLEASMKPKTFKKVSQPVFMGYYYKDEENQDDTVSVSAMLEMFDQLGTPESLKRKMAFPDAGDHVIASPITSKDVEGVKNATISFMEQVLGLEAIIIEEVETAETEAAL